MAVEVLSSDWSRDTVLKHQKYARAGLARYWIADPEGPTVVVHSLREGDYEVEGRHGPGNPATFDPGMALVTFDPADLAG